MAAWAIFSHIAVNLHASNGIRGSLVQLVDTYQLNAPAPPPPPRRCIMLFNCIAMQNSSKSHGGVLMALLLMAH